MFEKQKDTSSRRRSIMYRYLGESLQGLFWAVLVILTIFVHYTMCVDVPEFRYVGF